MVRRDVSAFFRIAHLRKQKMPTRKRVKFSAGWLADAVANCQGTHQHVLEAREVWKGLREERPTPALEYVLPMGPADPKTEEGEEEMKRKAKKRKRRGEGALNA